MKTTVGKDEVFPQKTIKLSQKISTRLKELPNVTRGKVNAFELRGFENAVSASQSEQKAFVFELSNDLLIGQSAVRLSNRKNSLSFEPL